MNDRVLGGEGSAGDDVLARIDPRLCVACKAARALCGIDPCPLLTRVRSHLPQTAPLGRAFQGTSPPSLFVGRHGYPKVRLGPMLPPDHRAADRAHHLDDPRAWTTLTIPDVVGLRSSLVRTAHTVDVAAASHPDRIAQLTQELALAARPVDADVRLARTPRFDTSHVGEFSAPHGPTADLESARLVENVRIERPLERVFGDTDLRAAPAMWDLYRSGVDPYHIEKVLAAGTVGVGRHRRFVPTRWSITATDDTLGDRLRERVRDLPLLDEIRVHQGGLFGNHFFVLLLPRIWSYDFIEVWGKGAFWARESVAQADHEGPEGRHQYAQATAGGYYAARRSVLEHLDASGRQATAIVLREITDAYTTPLGVWVVREAARLAMEARPLAFEDLPAALRHIDRHARTKDWQRHAAVLHEVRTQRTLAEFDAGTEFGARLRPE